MDGVRNLSLARKLYLSFGIVIALLVAVAGTAFWAAARMTSSTHQITAVADVKAEAANTVGGLSAYIHESQTRFVLNRGASYADHEGDVRVFEAALATLAKVSTTTANRADLAAIERAFATVRHLDAILLGDVKAGRLAQATEIVMGDANDAADTLAGAADAYRVHAGKEQAAAVAQFQAARSLSQWLVLLISGGAVLVALALAYLLARLIGRPLIEVRDLADAISEGDLDQSVAVRSRDEVGQMVGAFGRMIEYLKGLASAAERIAEGDLTTRVEAVSERDSLGRAFAAMSESLRSLVGQVTQTSETISAASQEMASTSEEAGRAVGEIAQAVTDVAAGAERQVRMVGEARASAEQTAEQAGQAREVAQDGMAAAQQASQAMEAVRESTGSVTEAIRGLADEVGADRRDRRDDHRDRLADEPAGVERGDRGGPCRGAGPRLRRRGRGGQEARRGVPTCGDPDLVADRGDPGGDAEDGVRRGGWRPSHRGRRRGGGAGAGGVRADRCPGGGGDEPDRRDRERDRRGRGGRRAVLRVDGAGVGLDRGDERLRRGDRLVRAGARLDRRAAPAASRPVQAVDGRQRNPPAPAAYLRRAEDTEATRRCSRSSGSPSWEVLRRPELRSFERGSETIAARACARRTVTSAYSSPRAVRRIITPGANNICDSRMCGRRVVRNSYGLGGHMGVFRNLSLGRKLYAGFGLVLALLVAVAGIALFEIGSLSSAHGRVSGSVVPKLVAAGAVAKSGSDMHFSQTRYVLDHGATRADYEKDVSVYSSDLAALQKLSTTAADRTSLAAVLSANARVRVIDGQLWTAVQKHQYAAAEKIVSGSGNDAADALTTATDAYQAELSKQRQAADTSFASARATATWLMIALGCAALLLGSAMAFVITRGIRRSVAPVLDRLQMLQDRCATDLRKGLELMAGGDLTFEVTPVTPPIENIGGDELGRVAAAVNGIRERTVASVEAYNASRESLKGLVGQVSQTSTTLSAASEEMASTSEEAGRAVGEIAQAVGDVAAGAERQVRMVEHARSTAEVTGEAATQARDVAQEGVAAAQEASQAMEAVRESTGSVTEAIRGLAEKSEQIGGIVETITGIAVADEPAGVERGDRSGPRGRAGPGLRGRGGGGPEARGGVAGRGDADRAADRGDPGRDAEDRVGRRGRRPPYRGRRRGGGAGA